jgi:hypothetical protein
VSATRQLLTSFAVITAIILLLTLLAGQPVHVVTVVRTVLIAAIGSSLAQWIRNRKAVRG